MAKDLHAELLGWVLEEIDKRSLGEEFGAAIMLLQAPVQTPQGLRAVPAWQVLLTGRSPLANEQSLWHMVPLAGATPAEEEVRAMVADGLLALRDLAASKLAGGNGKAPAGLARGCG